MTPRLLASVALSVAAALMLLAGGVGIYLRAELVDRPSFVERSISALDHPDVREVASERIADAIIAEGGADLIAVRPLLVSVGDALLRSPSVRRLLREPLRDVHAAILAGETRAIAVELLDAGNQILRALRSASPEIAGAVPSDIEPRLLELRPGAREASLSARAQDLARLSPAALALGLGLLLAALAVARDRSAALVRILVVLAVLTALAIAALAATRALVASAIAEAGSLAPSEARRAALGAWDALLGDLRAWALSGAAALLMLAGVVGARIGTPELARPLRSLLGKLATPAGARTRVLRGAAVAAVGALLILAPSAAVEAFALLLGGLLLMIGAWEAVTAVGARAAAIRPRERATRLGRLVVAGAATAAIALPGSALAVALATGGDEVIPIARPAEGCNGEQALCGRRLNEVVFPATHNSFSAARREGWLFANQRHGIGRQLEDGIRGLFLDPHPGIELRDGLVRTDLRREGTTLNRAARELGGEAVETAQRLLERARGSPPVGESETFLCHTLCELGAESMVDELVVLREFLARNPGEVVILFIEPFVPPEEIERAFADAGLLAQLAELRRDEPLPTLGELVADDRRVVVLTERDGSSPPWYMDAFSYLQDTSIRGTRPGRYNCAPNRGQPDSPMLLLNHWIDGFPPSVSANREIHGQFLRERALRCEREREMLPNLISVDFYDTSDVVVLARELNARPLRAAD